MNRTILIVISIFVLAVGGLFFLKTQQSADVPANNPYGKTDLDPETVKELGDPVYANQITDTDFSKQLAEKKELIVYFYSPTCHYCKDFSPMLVNLSNQLKADVKFHNLLEYQDGWDKYGIEGTPTVVHYKDGKEIARIVGAQPQDITEQWLKKQLNK